MINYKGISRRVDKLDGGNANPNEIIWFMVPVGAELPPECDPTKHTIFWDDSDDAPPAYSITRKQRRETMQRIDGNSRTLRK